MFWSKPKKMAVGEIAGTLPMMGTNANALFRIKFKNNNVLLEHLREALRTNPRIDVIDDGQGIFHEAMPFESVLLSGAYAMEDQLIGPLNQFFSALGHRPANIELTKMSETAEAVAWFGNLIQPGHTKTAGKIKVSNTQTGESAHLPWPLGHYRAVFALGPHPETTGLPALSVDLAGHVLVIRAERGDVKAQIYDLSGHTAQSAGQAHAMLTKDPVETISLDYDTEDTLFEGKFEKLNLEISYLLPDTTFSRPLAKGRTNVDMLEVIGIFLPRPDPGSSVLGTVVRFDANGSLLTHRLRPESHAVAYLTDRDRVVQWATGNIQKIRWGREAIVPGTGLMLNSTPAAKFQPLKGTFLLTSKPGRPLGWLPIALGNPEFDTDMSVTRSDVRFIRPSQIDYWSRTSLGEVATGNDNDHIWLDWLDICAQVSIATEDNGRSTIGLGRYMDEYARLGTPILTSNPSGVRYADDQSGTRANLVNNSVFRMGCLLVRLRLM